MRRFFSDGALAALMAVGVVGLALMSLPAIRIPESNMAALYVGVLAALITVAFTAAYLVRGTIVYSHFGGVLLAGWGLVVLTGISALLSADAKHSVVGTTLGAQTVVFLLAGLVVCTGAGLVCYRLRTLMPFGVTLGVIAVALVGALAIGGGATESHARVPVLGAPVAVSVLGGLFVTISAMVFARLRLAPLIFSANTLTMGLGLSLLGIVFLPAVWALTAVAVLAALVSILSHPKRLRRGAVLASVVVLALATLTLAGGLWYGQATSEQLQQWTHISSEVESASWSATLQLMREVYATSPLVGTGPNTYQRAWYQLMPAANGISTASTGGASYILTSIATGGLLVLVGWVLLLGTLLRRGVAFAYGLLQQQTQRRGHARGAFVSLVAAAYLWLAVLVTSPGPTIVLLAWVATGAFLGMAAAGEQRRQRLSLKRLGAIGTAVRTGLIVILLIAVSSIYGISVRIAGADAYGDAVMQAQAGDREAAEQAISEALSFEQHSRYARLAARLATARMQETVQGQQNTEARREAFRDHFTDAVAHAKSATSWGAAHWRNWRVRGDVYAAVIPYGIDGAYTSAQQAYRRTLDLAPRHAPVRAAFAEAAVRADAPDDARPLLQTAREHAPEYAPVYVIQARLAMRENRVQDAIAATESALQLGAADPNLLLQLGLLYYNTEAYVRADTVFQAVRQRQPESVSAAYFAGLTQYQLGNTQAARAAFAEAREDAGDSTELDRIIANIDAGRRPLAGIGANATSTAVGTRPSVPDAPVAPRE